MENKELLQKADMVLADLAAGGALQPEQANRFIDMVIDTPTIFKNARVERLAASKRIIDKIGFDQRILKPAVENTPLAEADRTKPTTGKVEIDTKEFIAEVRLGYQILEDNIEGRNLEDHIMRLIADRVALDLEELIIQGDTASADTYLKTMDGLLKRISSHIVDAQSVAISKELWKKLFKAVPTKYIRNKKEWGFYTSHSVEVDWRDFLADRATGAGDRFLLEDVPAVAYGVPVYGCAMMPETGTPTVVTSAIFTHPKNIIVGFHRDISVETDKDITARQFIIVVTCRVGLALEEEDATAKMINIKVA
ncbi:MAG: phage major capsid protein [Firmicutes bacterium]|nr:phage major capsid protein [Bacillota bacterium]